MDSNVVICRNEVIIEGVSVGQFESIETQSNSRTFGRTAVLTVPFYAIGAVQDAEPRARIRTVFEPTIVKPSSQVEVWCWYEGYERVLVFTGFITHIVSGFPSRIYLQDNTFILRFGSVTKVWSGQATLQNVAKDIIPIATEGFKAEREKQGLTRPLPDLTYSADGTSVQALTTSLSFREWGGRSPYDTMQKIIQLLVLYGGVTDDFNLYVGAALTDSTRTVTYLDTRYNVIGRDIAPVDGRFVDYDVKVTGILSNGKKYTATAGYGTSKSKEKNSQFDKSYGESRRYFSTLTTVTGLQEFADRQLEMLRGFRNRGTLQLVLYPKIQLLDQVQFNDTLFPELSSLYYVIDYTFRADSSGFFQTLGVTDKVFEL